MLTCPRCGEENPAKFRLCGYCGAALSSAPVLPAHEMRKTVTIVFSDLKDSTALGERIDSEALHEVKERYYAAMAAEIARHGGKVEKYIGDAIMAVFGLPKAHEDDALRAVRAAHGMRVALEQLNAELRRRYGVALANRTGINTGEVVANDDPMASQKLATGDAVNVAARLEQAAPADQIYLGSATWQLVRDAVEVEAVEPLALKGKSERVAAFRLVSAAGLDGNARRVDTPLTGRERELALLEKVWLEVRDGRQVRLVTVVGEAGLGKSRLIHEMVLRHGAEATVLRGRCLPYGDGITFWPLVEMASGLLRSTDSHEQAQARLRELTRDDDVAQRLASVIGLSQASYPLHELNWAARRFLESMAQQRPVIALIDDIHWAEPAFLALLEHLLDAASDSPILLLASARHELDEEHPDWPARPQAMQLPLEPLSDAAAQHVVSHLLGQASLPARVVERIVAAAEGNPLYVEQMLSMLTDTRALQHDDEASGLAGMAGLTTEGDDEIIVPPTIHALVEARVDRLQREERATLEPAAVVGLEFEQHAIEALAPEGVRSAVDKHLVALHHKHLIQQSQGADKLRFRFHHHLVRDTVYNGLLKRARVNLHTAYVRWADQPHGGRERDAEADAVLGYHLEQAHRYLKELGPLDDAGRALGIDGAQRLSRAGKRALDRGDQHAAANLLRRACAMLETSDRLRAELLPELGDALMALGNFTAASAVLDEADQLARQLALPRVGAASQIVRMFIRLFGGEPGEWADSTLRTARSLVPALEAEQAHDELAMAWRLIVLVHGIAGHYRQVSEAAERSTAHARLAGNARLVAKNSGIISMTALYGPKPARQGIAECEALIRAGVSDRQVECAIMCTLAQLKAMNGEFMAARELYTRGRATLRDLGLGVFSASTGLDVARVELLGGDLALAEREVGADYDFLTRMGENYFRSTMAALLSRIARDRGRDDDALAYSKVAEQATAPDDVESQSLWRSIRAPILARAGDIERAEGLARSALEMVQAAEAPVLQADALMELATVLRIAGRTLDAREAVAQAHARYDTKGHLIGLDACKRWLA